MYLASGRVLAQVWLRSDVSGRWGLSGPLAVLVVALAMTGKNTQIGFGFALAHCSAKAAVTDPPLSLVSSDPPTKDPIDAYSRLPLTSSTYGREDLPAMQDVESCHRATLRLRLRFRFGANGKALRKAAAETSPSDFLALAPRVGCAFRCSRCYRGTLSVGPHSGSVARDARHPCGSLDRVDGLSQVAIDATSRAPLVSALLVALDVTLTGCGKSAKKSLG